MTEDKNIASFKDLLPDAPLEVQDRLQSMIQPELTEEQPEQAQPIKAVLSDKMGSWKKHDAEGITSWVRRGGLATVEGDTDGWIAIVPSKEPGGGKLGPFKKAGLAKHAAETYLHEQGFVYYREDVKKMNEQFRLTMRRNKISRKM